MVGFIEVWVEFLSGFLEVVILWFVEEDRGDGGSLLLFCIGVVVFSGIVRIWFFRF